MPDLDIQVIDERKLTIPKGKLSHEQTAKIGKFISSAAEDGYCLVNLTDKRQNDYRNDSWSVGVILTFRKP